MDLSSIFGTLLSKEGISGIVEKTGASSGDVQNVLSSALPQLLSGADKQNTNSETSEGFVNALAQHAGNDTSNIASFFGKVDLQDGAKIIGHLLGKNGSDGVAQATGVNSASTSNILSSAAPMFMSLLGKQFSKEKRSMGSRIVEPEEAVKKTPAVKNAATKTAVSGGVKVGSTSRKAQLTQNSAGGTVTRKIVKK